MDGERKHVEGITVGIYGQVSLKLHGVLAVLLVVALAVGEVSASDRYSAQSWIHVRGVDGRWATPNVSTMVEIAPWTSIAEAARRLNDLPPGDRWVMLFIVTDDMADNPKDRCINRTVELRTTFVQPPMSQSARLARAVNKARNITTPLPALVPVTRRVSVNRLTEFRGPWISNGVAEVRKRIGSTMAALKAAGAQIDGVVVDNETTLDAAHFMGCPGALQAIQADPRWRGLATSLGLPATITDMTWGSNLYFTWTDIMSDRFDAALNTAIFQPVRALYPRAVVSNYCSGTIKATSAWPDINGHYDVRTTRGFGSHDTHEFYGWLAPGRVGKVAGAPSVSPSWMALRLEIYKVRGMMNSSSRPKQAWIASKSWKGETWGRVPLANTPMWDELVIQLAMNGIDKFLHFSPYLPVSPSEEMEALIATIAKDHEDLDRVLQMLNTTAREATGATLILAQPSWNDRVIASGRRVGANILWRFSFDEGVEAIEVEFTDGSKNLVRPEPGSCGTWFTHPAGRALKLNPDGKGLQFRLVEPSSAETTLAGL